MADYFNQVPINIPPDPRSSYLHHGSTFSSLPTPPSTTATRIHTTHTYKHRLHESRLALKTTYNENYSTNQPQAIAVGYPLCGTPGYTIAMGNYRESTHVQQRGNIKDCINECRSSGGSCQSIAFHKRYTMCLWFDKEVQGTWLDIDKKSEFVRWDLECDV